MMWVRHNTGATAWRQVNAAYRPYFRHNAVIRFARLPSDGMDVPTGLAEVAASGELDWLQLDYQRPRVAETRAGVLAELPEFATSLSDALRELRKALYLEPGFHVVASAGWSDAYGCVEHAAGMLAECGCGDLPVSAVRGSNLLPILEMLVASGVKLDHAETGAPFRELREPLLAADLQIGAGPLATAMAEGARVIVAGCFDVAAPLAASAVKEFGWSWTDYNRLAGATLAAEAAAWSDWRLDENVASESTTVPSLASSPRISLNESGEGALDLARKTDASVLDSLRAWLLPSSPPRVYADVACQQVELAASAPNQIRLGPATGAKTDGYWQLDILYQSGFAAEALIEFAAGVDPRLRLRIADSARRQFESADDPSGLTTTQELHCAAGREGASWLHVAYQSKSRQACERFVEQTLGLASVHRSVLRLATGRPAVHVHCGVWPTRIPRDAVDIAVETRLAKEWV